MYMLARFFTREKKETELTLAEHGRTHTNRLLRINGLHKVNEQGGNATIIVSPAIQTEMTDSLRNVSPSGKKRGYAGITRKSHYTAFKVRVALEAAKEQTTLQELAQKYEVAPGQISQWKKQLVEGGGALFERPNKKQKREREPEEERDHLLKTVGQLTVDNKFLTSLQSGFSPRLLNAWTDDPDEIRESIEKLNVSGGNEYYELAVEYAVEDAPEDVLHCIMISGDGIIYYTGRPDEATVLSSIRESVNAGNAVVVTFGIGTSYEEQVLKSIAQAGNGNFYQI